MFYIISPFDSNSIKEIKDHILSSRKCFLQWIISQYFILYNNSINLFKNERKISEQASSNAKYHTHVIKYKTEKNIQMIISIYNKYYKIEFLIFL